MPCYPSFVLDVQRVKVAHYFFTQGAKGMTGVAGEVGHPVSLFIKEYIFVCLLVYTITI